jgi:SAM-dependent methyltransferase
MTALEEARCPICHNNKLIDNGKPIISKEASGFIREDYRVLECRSCKFYFISPKISLAEDDWQKLYNNEYFGESLKWWTKRRAKDRIYRLDWLQNNASGNIKRFLDIGCGEGLVLLEAAKRGWNVYGIDISDNRVDLANNKSIIFRQGTLAESLFPDDHFDAIYLDSVLEHIVDTASFVKEISRILKPNGVIYVGVPNENSFYNDVRKVVFYLIGKDEYSVRAQPFKTPYHVVGFTKKSIAKIFESVDIYPIKIRVFSGLYEWRKKKFMSRVFMLHLALLPAYLLGLIMGKAIYIEAVMQKSFKSTK